MVMGLMVPPTMASLWKMAMFSAVRGALPKKRLLMRPWKRKRRVLGRPPTYSRLNYTVCACTK